MADSESNTEQTADNTCDKTRDIDEPATFEKAMETAGFGLFNLLLLASAMTAILANVFSTTTMAYILPIAECDLKLSLLHKGTLNSATYAGMIASAIVWGYLADTQGRRKILIIGYIADAICVFCSSMSQNFIMLVVFKFFGGLIVNGPGAVLFTYLTEMHGLKHRSRILMVLGMMQSLGTLILPMVAWLILPQDWDFVLHGSFNVHTWQIFLFVCGLPSLFSGLLLILLPESPKFLMSQGRNAEALKAFQKIYALNSRKPQNTYPINILIEEVPNRDDNANENVFTIESKSDMKTSKRSHRTLSQSLHEGWQQMKPMFRKPLLFRSLHVYLMQFCILLSLNTIRLWLPQLFASIAEYEALHRDDNESANLCTILEYSANKSANAVASNITECSEHKNISMDTYLNNIIVAMVGLIGYCFAGLIVKAMGPKRILVCGLFISGLLGFSLYWSNSGLMTLIISSIYISISSISTSSLLGLVVTLFPTTLRSFVIAASLMFGRLGALSGNMLFPVFVEIGCLPPFLMVGIILLLASALSLLVPSGKKTTFT